MRTMGKASFWTPPLQRRKGDTKGFTLIELLVVMIIIGILAAIAIPIYLNQQKSARDSAVIADLRNTATVVTSARLSPQEFADLFAKNGVNAWGENITHQVVSPVDWNSFSEVPHITLSDGTLMAIWMYNRTAGDWDEHEEGDFCLGAINGKSNYNFAVGTGMSAAHYDKYLYYDTKLGGVKTMKELLEAYNSGQTIACTGHVKKHKAATGL